MSGWGRRVRRKTRGKVSDWDDKERGAVTIWGSSGLTILHTFHEMAGVKSDRLAASEHLHRAPHLPRSMPGPSVLYPRGLLTSSCPHPNIGKEFYSHLSGTGTWVGTVMWCELGAFLDKASGPREMPLTVCLGLSRTFPEQPGAQGSSTDPQKEKGENFLFDGPSESSNTHSSLFLKHTPQTLAHHTPSCLVDVFILSSLFLESSAPMPLSWKTFLYLHTESGQPQLP